MIKLVFCLAGLLSCQVLIGFDAAAQRVTEPSPEGAPEVTAPLAYYGYRLFRAISSKDSTALFQPVAPEYPLGPGDEIQIHVWGAMNFNERLPVGPNGYVVLPKVDHRIYLNGVRFARLKPIVVEALSNFYSGMLTPEKISSGQVSVEVTLSRVRGIRILVAGEVRQPGAYTAQSTSADLFTVLMRAGGIKESGSLRNTQISHSDGRTQTVDLYDLLLKGSISAKTTFLQDRDVVFVPLRQIQASIDGQVKRPAIYEIKKGETLHDLIRMAGGPQPQADLGRIQIVRQVVSRDREVLDINATAAGTPVDLCDGDQITVFPVPDDWREAIVDIEGNGVRKPGTYHFTAGMTVQELIAQAGGLLEDALLNPVDLVRTGRDRSKSLVKLDLMPGLRGGGYRLAPLDRITIYSQHTLRGGDKTVSIRGQVKHPGTYTLAKGMRFYDLLFAAGGIGDPDFQKEMYLKRADLVRRDSTDIRAHLVSIDVRALLQGNGARNPELRSGDEVVVYPASAFEDTLFVRIDGLVRKPGRYRLLKEMHLGDLLLHAGGLKASAFPVYVEVSRIDGGDRGRKQLTETLKVPLDRAAQFLLKNGDMVFVRANPEQRPQRVVVVSGEVKFPGKYALEKENERLSDLIQRAGGLLPTAFPEGCTFHRSQGKPGPVRVDLERALDRDSGYDMILADGDSVHVPPRNWTVNLQGAVVFPGYVEWKAGARASYYIDAVGGMTRRADGGHVRIIRANGFVIPARKRFWFDPPVPPGSTIFVPEVPPNSSR